MIRSLVSVVLLWPAVLSAETALPALHDVTGVAADDVLNIRQSPDPESPILGTLMPDAKGVEVVARSEDGTWGKVHVGETSGWASLAYLSAQGHPDWFTLAVPLSCFGTEPFWSFSTSSETGKVRFSTPDQAEVEMDVLAEWPGEAWRPVAALQFAGAGSGGFAVLTAESCSDGMSDRAFGLRADLFLQASAAAPARSIRGCCELAP